MNLLFNRLIVVILLRLTFQRKGQPYYLVSHNGTTVIDTSYISFNFKDQAALNNGFKILRSGTSSFNETWEMPWGNSEL